MCVLFVEQSLLTLFCHAAFCKYIGSCFACETDKKKIVHPTYDEYLGGRDFQVDDVDSEGDFPNPLDVDYIFFDAERDSALANHLDGIIS